MIKKLCKESPPSVRNRIDSQFLPPIKTHSLKALLKIMETSDVGHSELVLRGIFARLCKYQRLRLIYLIHIDQLTFASPRYTSQEMAVNNNDNRARLRRSLALIRYLMQSNPTNSYLVKYMQLPTDFEMFIQGTPSKKRLIKRVKFDDDDEVDDDDNNNEEEEDNNNDIEMKETKDDKENNNKELLKQIYWNHN